MPTSMRTDSHTDAEPAADTDAKSNAQADADTADCSLCHHNETMRHWLCKQKSASRQRHGSQGPSLASQPCLTGKKGSHKKTTEAVGQHQTSKGSIGDEGFFHPHSIQFAS